MDHFIHEQNLAHSTGRRCRDEANLFSHMMLARCGCGATTVAVAQKVGLTGSCFRHRHAPKRLAVDVVLDRAGARVRETMTISLGSWINERYCSLNTATGRQRDGGGSTGSKMPRFLFQVQRGKTPRLPAVEDFLSDSDAARKTALGM